MGSEPIIPTVTRSSDESSTSTSSRGAPASNMSQEEYEAWLRDETDKANREIKRPKAFTGEFNIGQLSYPEDLMSAPRQGQENKTLQFQNYAVFFITVQGESANKSDSTSAFDSGLVVSDGREELNAGVLGGLAAGSEAGAAVGGSYNNLRQAYYNYNNASYWNQNQLNQQILRFLKPAAAAGTVIVAGAATVGYIEFKHNEQRTLKQVIALHTPNDLRITYGVDYAEENSDVAAGLSMASPINYTKSMVLRAPLIGGALQRATGIAPNPKTEVLFQNVKFRTFTFTYDFFPRSYMEADNVREIIKMFKLHMHPEFAAGSEGFQYVYPSEFDIQYYINGRINDALPKHTRSVLTDMDVNYAPSAAGFTAFESGMPTQITMTLTFKELALLTKQDIEVGF